MGGKNLLKGIALTFASPFCICNKCPSYPKGKDPKVYCERGRSSLPVEQRGCLCPKCFVWKVNRFKNQYYCVIGKDQKSKI